MRRFVRSPYVVGLGVLSLAAWAAWPPRSEHNPIPANSAAVADSETQQRPNLVRAARLIVAQTNDFRDEHRLNPADNNAALADAAGYFADYMAKTDEYSHTADGRTPAERATEYGYEYCLVSENIAYVFSSAGFSAEALAEKMVEGWKQSPEHRKNMLDALVTEIGVAVAHSAKSGNYYGVQMFGRPKSLSISFTIENKSEVVIEYNIGERAFELPPRYRYTHEECFPVELMLQVSHESQAQRFRPRNGDHFIVTGPADALQVEKK